MDWFHFRGRLEALETLAQRVLAAVAGFAGVSRIQSGTVNLVLGTATVNTFVTANTRVVATIKTSQGGDGAAEPFTTRIEVTARVPGNPGSFQIAALTNAGVADATNTSSVDWIAIN